MQTFETAAIVSLIDRLSGPLESMARRVGHINAANASSMDKAAGHMARVGATMTAAVSLPVIAGIVHMSEHAVEYSKVENTLHGVFLNRSKTMKDLTVSSEEYARSQEKILSASLKQTLDDPILGPMTNSLEARHAGMQAIKAGLDTEAAAAVSSVSGVLAIAGRIKQSEASEDLITLGNAFGIVTKNADGSTKSVAEVTKAYSRFSDLVATMSTNANMSTQDAVEALKLPAPLWHQQGLDPGILGASVETLAERGVKGEEAGAALRSMIQKLTAPKSMAIPTLLQAGIDMTRFQTFKEAPNADAFERTMKMQGVNVDDSVARKAFNEYNANGLTQQVWTELNGSMTNAKGKQLTANLALKYQGQYFQRGVEHTDIPGMMMAIRDKDLSAGQLSQIFEPRQVTRLLGLLQKAKPGEFDPFAQAMTRMLGPDWENTLRHASGMQGSESRASYLGNAEKMASEHMQGMEGAMNHLRNSWERLNGALYDAHVFDDVAGMIHLVSRQFDRLAKLDPSTLRILADVVAGIAVAGPALVLTSGAIKMLTLSLRTLIPLIQLLSFAGGSAKGKMAATEAEAVAAGAAAGGSGRLAFAARAAIPMLMVGTGLADVYQHSSAGAGEDEKMRERARNLAMDPNYYKVGHPGNLDHPGTMTPVGMDAAYLKAGSTEIRDFGLNQKDPSSIPTIGSNPFRAGGLLPEIAPRMTDVQVTGEADVKADINVTVSPSPLFMAEIDKKIVQANPMHISSIGNTGRTFAGSNGVTPGFKPTLRGY